MSQIPTPRRPMHSLEALSLLFDGQPINTPRDPNFGKTLRQLVHPYEVCKQKQKQHIKINNINIHSKTIY
jgi:hypothetical protein